MDLVGDMLLEFINREFAGQVEAIRIRPALKRRFSRLPILRKRGAAFNADRLINRYRDYPKALRQAVRSGKFDLFHLADHSYAQLIHEVPAGRAVVTCHDLDTFRCLLKPDLEPRPAWFQALTRRTLDGLKRAAVVTCDSEQTRFELLEHKILPESRLKTVPLGIHPECRPDPDPAADQEVIRLLGPRPSDDSPELLHVGSNIPRKRMDVLLKVFAEVRKTMPGARLIKVGGAFQGEHANLARSLGLEGSIVALPFTPTPVLAALYRRVSLVLQPSEAEGFGLPVVEALACGSALVASDLPVLREVAGEGALFVPVADLDGWSSTALQALEDVRNQTVAWEQRREAGFRHVECCTWIHHVCQVVAIYRDMLEATSNLSN